jgi:hypothetical protein
LEGTKTGRLRQGVVSVAVLMIHVSLISVATRSRYSQPSIRDVVSTWIVLPTAPLSKTSSQQPLTHAPGFTINPIRIELPNTESVPIPPADSGSAIDWTVEAERAAAALSNAPKPREFGSFPRADSQETPVHPTPAHHAAEQYRDPYGNSVVWVSDRCYVVSERAALGMPGVLAQSRPTHTVCVDPSAPEGELFKDLPAYKKYHPK